jgi:hypothetical protein
VSENHEHILVDFLVVCRVDDGIGDFGLVHVKIATQCSPKDTFKGSDTVTGNNTRDKSNVEF